VEQSEARILELEDKIKEILKENQKLQDSSGKATEKEKRAKGLSFFCSYGQISSSIRDKLFSFVIVLNHGCHLVFFEMVCKAILEKSEQNLQYFMKF